MHFYTASDCWVITSGCFVGFEQFLDVLFLTDFLSTKFVFSIVSGCVCCWVIIFAWFIGFDNLVAVFVYSVVADIMLTLLV